MEPERKIDKLLRAYARKRRDEAGEPLKLHAADRRRLHEAVARRPAAPSADAPLTLWELMRQQWAWLLGFALVVFFCAILWLPSFSKAKSKAQTLSAVNQLKQIGAAARIAAADNQGRLPASLDALTNGWLSDKVLTDPQSGKPFVYLAGGKLLANLPSNVVLAFSPGDRKGRAVLFADGRVEIAGRDRFAELTNRGLLQMASAENVARRQLEEKPAAAPPVASTPALAPPDEVSLKMTAGKSEAERQPSILTGTVAGLSGGMTNRPESTLAKANVAETRPAFQPAATAQPGEPALGATAQFYRKGGAANLEASFQNSLAGSNASPVLANFQIRQSGPSLVVLDHDGSVYRGSLQFENAPARAKDQSAAGAVAQTADNFSFQVSGTNLTLKQNVVFTGQLLIATNAPPVQGPVAADSFGRNAMSNRAPANLAAPPPQLPWSNLQVMGTAEIDHTKQIQINAAPLAQ